MQHAYNPQWPVAIQELMQTYGLITAFVSGGGWGDVTGGIICVCTMKICVFVGLLLAPGISIKIHQFTFSTFTQKENVKQEKHTCMPHWSQCSATHSVVLPRCVAERWLRANPGSVSVFQELKYSWPKLYYLCAVGGWILNGTPKCSVILYLYAEAKAKFPVMHQRQPVEQCHSGRRCCLPFPKAIVIGTITTQMWCITTKIPRHRLMQTINSVYNKEWHL